MMIGGLIWGNLADLIGRRPVLIMALGISGLFGLASSLAQSFLPFVIFRFFSIMG
jgi:MFS family permease